MCVHGDVGGDVSTGSVFSGVFISDHGMCAEMAGVHVRRLSRRERFFYDVCRCNG